MRGDKTQLIVHDGDCANHSIRVRLIHHSHFPELRAEGKDCREGAEHLINLLMRAQSSVGSGWRRRDVDTAIDDVNAFLDDLKSLVGAPQTVAQGAWPE